MKSSLEACWNQLFFFLFNQLLKRRIDTALQGRVQGKQWGGC